MVTHLAEGAAVVTLLGRPSVARPVFAVVFGPQTGAHKNHFFHSLKEQKVGKTSKI